MVSAAWIWSIGVLFACSHSILASLRCKQYAADMVGLYEPRYRLYYSLLSILSTVAWITFVHQLSDAPIYHTDGVIQWALIVVQMVGVSMVLAAFQPIDGFVFLGLRKASQGRDPFIVKGIYRWLRHPMYSGAMLILLAMPQQTWNGLNLSLVVALYFIVGSRFEESRMLREHPDYAAYRQRVAGFIPNFSNLESDHRLKL